MPVFKKLGLVVILVLSFSLVFPSSAFALQAGQIKNTKSSDYLVTNFKYNGKNVINISYYKNRLVKKASSVDGSKHRYYYDKKNRVKKYVRTENGSSTTYKYYYKNNKLSKCVMNRGTTKLKILYKLNKKNKISKADMYTNIFNGSYIKYSTMTYKYNKYGYRSKMKSKTSDNFIQFTNSDEELKTTTNKYGLVTKYKRITPNNTEVVKYKYKMKGKYPKAITQTNSNDKTTMTFNYKKVSKAKGTLAKYVKKQQEYLLNHDFINASMSAYL